jgi:hypothetical protein
MRLDINLASQPYEDARQFWVNWGAAVGVVAVLTLVLLTLDITGWVNARRDRAAIAQIKAMIADRDRLRAQAEKTLNLPQNRTTRDESQFLNGLIERKAFSWTQVLESLEKVMPPRVHLIGISPQLDEDNQLGLKMSVGGDSRDRALELARRMEESHRFAQTQVTSENFQPSNRGGDNELFDMEAIYIPDLTPAKQSRAASPKTAQPIAAQPGPASSTTAVKPKAEVNPKPKPLVPKASKP